MIEMLIETIVVAFVLGGILGAITALHLSNTKKVPVKIGDRSKPSGRR